MVRSLLSAPQADKRSNAAQWEVASTPFNNPAAPKIKLPVQTEIVQVKRSHPVIK